MYKLAKSFHKVTMLCLKLIREPNYVQLAGAEFSMSEVLNHLRLLLVSHLGAVKALHT